MISRKKLAISHNMCYTVVEAYSNHSYNGNLLDLIQGHGYMLASTTPEKFVKNENLETKEEFIWNGKAENIG